MKPAVRRTLSSLLLLLISLLISLLIAEGLARFIMKKMLKAVGADIEWYYFTTADGETGIKPNSRGWHVGYDDRSIWVEINSLGFRGPELRKAPDYRIVFLGDSVVFAGGVPWENTFTSLWERTFKSEGFDVEIVNSGIPDVGIDQYLLKIERNRFTGLNPDLIVIGLYLNDSRPPQGHVGEKTPNRILTLLEHPLWGRSALVKSIKFLYMEFEHSRGREFSHRFQWIPLFTSKTWMTDPEAFRLIVSEAAYDWGAAWTPGFAATVYPQLLKIKKWCDQRRVKLAVVFFPVSIQVYTRWQDPYVNLPQREFAAFAHREFLSYFDLLPELKRHRYESMFKDQCHLNKKGNEIVSEAIYYYLKEILISKPDLK